MRHVKAIGLVLTAAFTSACASGNPYASSAAALSGVEYSGVVDGFSKLWKPIGKDYSYSLSQEEAMRGGTDLTGCVNDLSARFSAPVGRAPGRELRAVQLVECMSSKGWHLVIEQVVVTR